MYKTAPAAGMRYAYKQQKTADVICRFALMNDSPPPLITLIIFYATTRPAVQDCRTGHIFYNSIPYSLDRVAASLQAMSNYITFRTQKS